MRFHLDKSFKTSDIRFVADWLTKNSDTIRIYSKYEFFMVPGQHFSPVLGGVCVAWYFFDMLLGDYLSLLTWRGCRIFLQDFKRLQEDPPRSPERFKNTVCHPESREFLIRNRSWWKTAEEDYKQCSQKNYRITWPGKEDYPLSFLKLDDPPLSITYLGNLPHCDGGGYFPMTVVGSRKGHEIVFNWMDFYLSKILKEKKICLISGGARGVDQKAHSTALRLNSPTVCFLPSGLDRFYPDNLNFLKKGILDCGGGFISCFSPWEEMRKPFFHIRNRLMACYSKLVFVAQAQIRSGTMLTAGKALDCGAPVAVLPGPPLSVLWTGNLQLIYDGAHIVRDDVDLSLLIESLSHESSPAESESERITGPSGEGCHDSLSAKLESEQITSPDEESCHDSLPAEPEL